MKPTVDTATLSNIQRLVPDFDKQITAIKKRQQPRTNGWYPYGSLSNFQHLKLLLGGGFNFSDIAAGGKVMDIGAADGDTAYFLETLGFDVAIVDHAPTNYNHLEGARLLKEQLQSAVDIHDIDLDSQFELPVEQANLAIFLGILYHLKNPYFALEQLARRVRYCLLSTRIARYTPDGHLALKDYPVAYLLHASESNNDATNFWIFSEGGLRRLFERTGWLVERYLNVGDTRKSNPADAGHDERAFCLLKSASFS